MSYNDILKIVVLFQLTVFVPFIILILLVYLL